jgi:hypothetical protein
VRAAERHRSKDKKNEERSEIWKKRQRLEANTLHTAGLKMSLPTHYSPKFQETSTADFGFVGNR